MKIPILDLKPQYASLKAEIHEAIDRVLESSAFIMGPDVKLFEQEVAAYLGVKHAIGVNSGTDALVIGLKALNIGEGDEVITTPFSFFATAESISNVGAKPIFVDIDPLTFNIDPSQIEAKITPQTAAIMPVHLYGQPAEMAKIIEIAQKHKLKVIEDCAQAFGAKYYSDCEDSNSSTIARGQAVGSIGDVGAFSFFPSKNLGAYGDGGLVVTDDDHVAEMARMLRVHGSLKKYHNEIFGYNSRLDTIQAAVLRIKLLHIDKWNQARREVAQKYNSLLKNLPDIVLPHITQGHVFHQYTIRVLGGSRDLLKENLQEKGIGTMVYYPVPQDQLPVYRGQYDECNISHAYAQQVLSLPIWAELEKNVQSYIADQLSLIATNAKLR